MSGGGQSSNTTTQQNGPPQQFLDAFTNVNNQAQNVAATPYSPYPGNTVAPMSPDQLAAISGTENAQGIAAPYINTAAQYINNSTKPLAPGAQPYVDQATGLYGQQAANAGQATGIYQGLTHGLSPEDIQRYQSPYTNDVIHATEAEFNNQNQQQQQGVIGNAISKGSWGGDRASVAQGILAGQQQLAQAPVIAGLENQGYAQALQAAQQQQQMQAGAAQGILGAGQGYGAAGQGILAGSGQLLGANQANSWLNSQAGAGMANLGNQAQNTTYAGLSALQNVGNIQQQQAQASLNAPYQQYLAQQAYPFQTTGWLANIAEGLGGASGGTASTTSPGPSTGSQIAGGGLAAAGILGQTNAFGSSGNPGWLSSLFGSGGNAGTVSGAIGADPAISGADANLLAASPILESARQGGAIPQHRAPGGGIVGDAPPFGNAAPVSGNAPFGISMPNVDVSVVPGSAGNQIGNTAQHASPHLMNTSTGSTTTTETKGGDSVFGSLLKDAGIIAAGIYGTPAGAFAAQQLSNQVHFDRGGGIVPFPAHRSRASGGIIAANDDGYPHEPMRRAAGGDMPISVSMIPGSYAGSPQVPQLSVGSGPTTSGGIVGNQSVQDYLNSVAAGASHAPPPTFHPPPPQQMAPPPIALPPELLPDMPRGGDGGGDGGGEGGGGMQRGGRVPHRAEGGPNDYPSQPVTPDDDMHSGIFADEVPARGMDYHDDGPAVATAPSGIIADTPVDRRGSSAEPDAPDATFATNWTPQSADATTHASPDAHPTGGNGDLWRTLMYTGLGIMGGTSPHAAVNIGRGALAGLSANEQAKQADAQIAYRQSQADTLAHYRQQQGETNQQKLALEAADLRFKVEHQTATLGEERRYHDILATQRDVDAGLRKDALDAGHFTYQPVTMQDPDNPGKTISGVNQYNTKAKPGESPVQFIRTDTDPNKPGSAATMGAREAVFTNRVVAAGNQALAALENISDLPLETSTGPFGGHKQSTGLLSAAKESIVNSLTSQNVQTYNSMLTGVTRSLAAIEASGLAPGQNFTDSMGSVILKAGDTPLTRMHKMAEMRQIIVSGLAPNLVNPRIPQQQRDFIDDIIQRTQKAVPFTQHDVIMFERDGKEGIKGKPGQTLADFAKSNNLGGSQQAPQKAAASAAPKVGEVRGGYTFKGGDPADPNSWQK